MLINNESKTSIRMSDFLGVIPSINGKIELVYEGEQEGAEQISYYLIKQAVKSLFTNFFPKIEKLEKSDQITPYDKLLGWFFKDNELFISDNMNDKEYVKILNSISEIKIIVEKFNPQIKNKDLYFMIEFLLWGLESFQKLNKYRTLEGFQFKDSLGSYINRL